MRVSKGRGERRPTLPGEILALEFMEPLHLSQTLLAELMRVPRRRINEIIGGRREITPDTALRLEAVFGVSAQFWLNLQNMWNLGAARDEREQEYKAIAKEAKREKLLAAG